MAITQMLIAPSKQGRVSYNTNTCFLDRFKPQCHHLTAMMATGVLKPAMLLRIEPKEKMIINACNRRSEIFETLKCLTISNCPLCTITLKRNTAGFSFDDKLNKVICILGFVEILKGRSGFVTGLVE